ncbi:hypothetical protein NITHO_1650017 [Nitrolancea hollandica Lb]|uniref:Uncharacterized protein n=1 Tax=Nitrolancea hollandica Lb TaxID=1129897 RepID=I4EDY6_9BACT|nr:hypothetical protein NITHO_1650017 [Nitrolancea hollandica Lb]
MAIQSRGRFRLLTGPHSKIKGHPVIWLAIRWPAARARVTVIESMLDRPARGVLIRPG